MTGNTTFPDILVQALNHLFSDTRTLFLQLANYVSVALMLLGIRE